jgi:cation diffusion facilitator CzcD-associated flavoprotein CzcO
MSETFRSEDQIALIGGGPSGLAGARALQRQGLPFQGFEAHEDLGGLWNLASPRARAYASLRMLTSKQTTDFSDLPMPPSCPDYPGQADALRYLRDYADSFDLRRHFRFGTLVRRVEPVSEKPDSLWRGLRTTAAARWSPTTRGS